MELLVKLPVQVILSLCSDDPQFAQLIQREFYLQTLLTQKQALRFPLKNTLFLNQPIHGLCHLVLYYPIEDYTYGEVPTRDSFNQPASTIRRLTHSGGERSFINGLSPQDDGYLLLINWKIDHYKGSTFAEAK